jgi:hypothetical protein
MKKPIGRQPGYTVSEETKALISKSAKGRIAVNKRRVLIEGVTYDSLRAASKALNLPSSTLTYRCLSVSETFKEWRFI